MARSEGSETQATDTQKHAGRTPFEPISEAHAELVRAAAQLTRGARTLALADLIRGEKAFKEAFSKLKGELGL